MTTWLGIDVSKATLDVVADDDACWQVPNTPTSFKFCAITARERDVITIRSRRPHCWEWILPPSLGRSSSGCGQCTSSVLRSRTSLSLVRSRSRRWRCLAPTLSPRSRNGEIPLRSSTAIAGRIAGDSTSSSMTTHGVPTTVCEVSNLRIRHLVGMMESARCADRRIGRTESD